MTKLVTKASMIEALNTLSDEKIIKYVGRALVAIFRNQTESEKQSNDVENRNYEGFSSSDAKSGSITAKYFLKHGTLQGWMLDNWLQDWKGAPRITKYHRQLNQAAIEKAAKAAKAKSNEPSFKHDAGEAEKHVFLGKTSKGEDVWFGIKFNEVVLRFGNKPEENRAMPVDAAMQIQDPSYKEASAMVVRYVNRRR